MSARYTLHFEWPTRPPAGAVHTHLLLAGDADDARIEAALIYAGHPIETLPPAYRIVVGARRVVCRFPEPGWLPLAASRRG